LVSPSLTFHKYMGLARNDVKLERLFRVFFQPKKRRACRACRRSPEGSIGSSKASLKLPS
jgi:hypothetical protein